MNRWAVFFILILLAFASPAGAADKVTVGAHVNDIQEIDLQSHNYRLDLYVWFRWKNPAISPWKTAEFMNAFEPADHVRTPLYDKPLKMPDGSYYMIVRDQGKFSVKFPLQKYPFDNQQLGVIMEDSVHDANELVYVPDTSERSAVSLSDHLYLPGFNISAPVLKIISFAYPTRFGDISQKEASTYSRALFEVPVARPWLASGIKVFLPIFLIIFCTALVLFVHPAYIEGRLGVGITALLTLVALQLTTASSLPEVDYMLMTDKVYLLSYLFIIATMMQLVRTSRFVQEQKYETVTASDRRALKKFGFLFTAGLAFIFLTLIF